MVAIPYLFNEIERIFQNTPLYVIVLEAFLLLSVIWLLLFKRNGRGRRYTKAEEEEIIAKYEPEPLIAETDPNHQLLQTRLVQSKVGKRVVVDGHECLNLATHNYLGLLEDEKILEDACTTLKKYGVGSCGPRGFYGTMDVHLDLEDRLAKFMGMEESVVYSYGFSTIASAIPAYAKRGDVVFADEMVSFAIQKGLDASRSTIYYYKHNNMADLERLLIEQQERDTKNPKKAAKTRRFLVAEGIYMNTGEICPLPELVALRAKYKLRLFLDESISFGTLGKTGHGLTEHFNVDLVEVDLIMAGMENSLATIGGFCVGSHFIVEHQRLSGLGYCFSASLPPLLTQAAITALDRFEREPQMFTQLQEISRKVQTVFGKFSKLKLRANELSPIKHLYIAEERENADVERELLIQIANKCIASGVAVIEARYLNNLEKHAVRQSIRITVNRLLTDADIKHAFDIIESVSNEVL
ncbi:serine palmitoyltransferase 1 [Zeugodacus cucurbitae]|uniref:Serine palmitoyltransferase 1 n=1 Tax=Zeugodacus cucurbitae TaxID=28588 RepID=A0A0A1XAL2_ZEUCU|nr:serine palmitoyltransferase 1 [Zeugodacus cucurbitae]XP_011191638.1 serine palmitoyltransferase 1 [Zeugodacus cucurbitae]XP_011191640.1 serine palmitoyltransferase 1 [Zeugodacus cucurbitae]XP_054090425.1 serine palmitoyltransferase 1 [Zeugodacus cucurbitae]